jgi:hypothetical protein
MREFVLLPVLQGSEHVTTHPYIVMSESRGQAKWRPYDGYTIVRSCKFIKIFTTSRCKFIKIFRTSRGPPLWSSGQSSWLQIRRPGFDFRHYQNKSSGSGTGSTQPREYN